MLTKYSSSALGCMGPPSDRVSRSSSNSRMGRTPHYTVGSRIYMTYRQRRRIKTEEKAKVVADEFVEFLAALAVLQQDNFEE